MEAQTSSPRTTLLILLGASEWPLFPEFQSAQAFSNAAKEVRDYFLDPRRFGIPVENVLDAFDSKSTSDELDAQIGQFLEQRLAAMKASGQGARDLLVYFVGHGGFVGRDSDFYLAIRRTRVDNPRASGLSMLALADTLTEKARYLRRIVILDCCFAAAAFSAFQAGPAQVAIGKTIDAFEVGQRRGGFPAKGTTLLCSSGHKTPSLLLPDGSSTMFTKAVLDTLAEGITSPQDRLSLREVKDLAADLLSGTRSAPKPVVLSPDQSEGDVADIPFFPNPYVEREQARLAKEAELIHRMEEERRRRAMEELARQAEGERNREAREKQERQVEEENHRQDEEQKPIPLLNVEATLPSQALLSPVGTVPPDGQSWPARIGKIGRPTQLPQPKKYSHFGLTIGVLFLLVALIGGTVFFMIMKTKAPINHSTPSTSASPASLSGNVTNPALLVDIAKPAVVRIITSINGHLDVQFPNGTVTFPQGNGKTYQEQLSGTGTFITANGDILTADNIVSPPPDVLQTAAAPDVANYINQHPETGIAQTTSDQVSQTLQTGQLKSTAHYDQKSSEIFLSTDYTGPLTAQSLSAVPAQMHATVDRIEKESPFDQMDVAIVHAPFQDTPAVQLGDSLSVQPRDQLTIIGFPGNADVNDTAQKLFTSSVNNVTVSSIKTNTAGAPLIQVGNIEHGDGGGPALNSKGTVVGIVSFGYSNNSGSFLQVSNSAQQLVAALKLNTTPGELQQQWSQAFISYAANTPGHWHRAQQQFEQIVTNYPFFKGVLPYLNNAQTQAKKE